jgi:mono/diheme cytochrome c family protein
MSSLCRNVLPALGALLVGGSTVAFTGGAVASATGTAASVGVTTPSFKTAQAERGRAVYKQSCAACHGAALEGVSGPPLLVDADPSDPRTLGDVYYIVSHLMPKTNPGSLSPAAAAAVTAYLLSANGAKPDERELTPAEAAASTTRYGRVPARKP